VWCGNGREKELAWEESDVCWHVWFVRDDRRLSSRRRQNKISIGHDKRDQDVHPRCVEDVCVLLECVLLSLLLLLLFSPFFIRFFVFLNSALAHSEFFSLLFFLSSFLPFFLSSSSSFPSSLALASPPTACLQRIIREEGWRTLYRGVGLSLLSSVPYATIAFTAYDNLKGRYERAARKKEGSLEENQTTSFADSLLGQKRKHSIMAGSMAFTFASVCVFPIDTLRRRLIVDGAPGHQQRLYSRLPKAAPVAAASTKTGAAAAGSAGGSAAAAAAATTVGRAGLGESEFSTNVRTKVNLSSGGNGPGEGMAEAAATRGPPAVQAALRIWYEEGIIGKFFHGCLHFFFRCFEVILQTCKLTYVFFFFFLLQDFIVVCFLPSFAHYHVLPLCL